MNEKISIIIPVYNLEKYIKRTAESVLKQTYTNIEVIIVDDGSSDESWKIIQKIADKDNRVIPIHQENGGVTSARLKGVRRSTGEWIGFVDGDDEIESDMYEILLNNAKKYNADISHCGYQMIFEDGRVNYFHNTGCLVQIAGIIILLIVLLIGGIYGSIWWKFYGDSVGVVSADKVDPNAKKVKIAKEKKKDKDVYNVLLVGTDSRDPDADRGRSDSMMMVSFNKKEGKSTAISFLRDSLVDIDGHGKSRLGHTYAYGGVGLTINTINKTYDLDIQNYITISFDDLVNVIDEIGGVTVFISEEEAAYYRENGMPDIQAGDVTLTGSQALAHARNRTLGNDFERTRRQRSVMYGIYRKIMEKKDPSALLPLINYAVNHVKTNMSVSEMYSMAKDVLSVDDLKMQQTCIPQDGTYTDITYEGMQVLKVDFDANKKKIEQLLY